jgi:hypothetical protein
MNEFYEETVKKSECKSIKNRTLLLSERNKLRLKANFLKIEFKQINDRTK